MECMTELQGNKALHLSLQMLEELPFRIQQNAYILSLDLLNSIEMSLLAALASVRRCANATRPAIRLPPEILSYIMHYASFSWSSMTDTLWDRQNHSTKVARTLSHVCHYWRNVALGSSNLWSTINSSHFSAAIDTLIYRSQGFPLDVDIDFSRHVTQPVVRAVCMHSSRIRTFCCITMDDFDDSKFVDCLSFPADQLESLSIISSSTYGRKDPLLFEGHVPCLTELSLTSTSWLPANHFYSLTHLHLRDCEISSISSLLKFLSRTPKLEDFVLESASDMDITIGEDDEPLALPHLRKFLVHSLLSPFIGSLLSRLVLPPDLVIDLSEARGLPLALPSLQLLDTITSVSLAVSGGLCSITATGQTSALHTSWMTMPADVRQGGLNLLLEMMRIPVASLTELCIVGQPNIGVGATEDLLAIMPSLATIIADRVILDKVYDALGQFPVDASGLPLCSALSTLHCTGSPPDIARTTALVESRARWGYPIEHFIIDGITPRQCVRYSAAFESHFESLVLNESDCSYKMILPNIISEESHGFWRWT